MIIQQNDQFVNYIFVKNDICIRTIYNLLLFYLVIKGTSTKLSKIHNIKNAQKRRKLKWYVFLRKVYELKKNILFTDKNDREHFTFSVIFAIL